jgi:CheY-like chemotaxis protein
MPAPLTDADSRPRPTALVIDDEASVRWVIRRALEPTICNVLEAADGITGILRVRQASPPVDLVLVDLKLANLNGLEVIERLRQEHPHLPLLCITGFGATATTILESTVREHHVPVLLKPFKGEEVAEAVRTLLDRARRRPSAPHQTVSAVR